MNFVTIPQNNDFYTVVLREGNLIMVKYGKGMEWWHDLSRELVIGR